MWMEELDNGKFKYTESYTDLYTEKRKYKSVTLTSKSKQAERKARQILDDKIATVFNAKKGTSMSLNQLMAEWYPLHLKTLRNGSIRTHNAIKSKIEETVDMDILVNNLDSRYLQNWVNSLENYSYGYTKSVKNMLGQLLKYAVDMSIIEYSPMENVKLVKQPQTLDDLNKIGAKYFEKEQAEAIISYLNQHKKTGRLARLAEFMYLTGCRIGEAIILKESDFDFNQKTVKLHGTIDTNNGYKNATKGLPKTSKSYREIGLTDRCVDLVKQRIMEMKLDSLESGNQDGYIFSTASGTPIQVTSFNNSLKRAGAKLGYPNSESFSSHYFRHTHVSLLAENNVPLKAIMERVGHSDSKMTTEIYTHVTKKMESNITDKLENLGL